MFRRLAILGCMIWFVAAFSVAQAAQPDVPWERLTGSDRLNDTQKAVVKRVLEQADSYAGCSDKLIVCLSDKPVEKAVMRQANFVLRRALLGRGAADVLKDLEARALSAYPPLRYKPDLEGLTPSGDPNSLIKVVVYADFQCPYCNIAGPALRRISLENPGLIAYYYKNFPVKSHPRGLEAAMALLAADRQGKFWEAHDKLFKEDEFLGKDLERYAAELGLDMARFNKDRLDDTLMTRIRKEKEEGLLYGMIGTPGIFINGKFYKGSKSYEELLDFLMEEKDIIRGEP